MNAAIAPDPAVCDSIGIRAATSEDWPALHRFYAAEHPQRTRLADEARWRWTFVERSAAEPRLPFHVLERSGAIVGGIGVLRSELNVRGARVDSVHPVNYFVGADVGGLPSLRLLRAAINGPAAVVASYVSDSALRLLLKSGFVDLSASLRDYYCALGAPRLAHLAGMPVALARTAARTAWRARLALGGGGVAYRADSRLDIAVGDRFVAMPTPLHFRKSADWLRWRYERAPAVSPVFVHQYLAGECCGLAVLHIDRERGEAVLLDALWTARGEPWLVGLVERAVGAAAETGARVLTTSCCSPRLERALGRLLFRSVPSPHNFVVYARDPALRAQLAVPADWHFTLGDTDVH